MKRIAILLSLVLALSLAPPTAEATVPEAPEILAQYALIAETTSGRILFAQNEHERAYPASLTKIMTVLLALEAVEDGQIGMDDVVTVTASALEGLHPQGSSIQLRPGDQITVRDLCYAAMVASGNDACNVLGEYLSGNLEAFIDRMNERAAELGCENTRFANACGLDLPDQYTTAYDMYLITMAARKILEFTRIAYTVSYRIEAIEGHPNSVSRDLVTTNHLISQMRTRDYYYSNAKGIKTGHTTQAGYCLVSMAGKNNLETICVVMNSAEDENGRIGSFTDSEKLHEWVFNNFEYRTIVEKGRPMESLPVVMGKDADSVKLVTKEKLDSTVPRRFDPEALTLQIQLFDDVGNRNEEGALIAPVERDDLVFGEIRVSYGDIDYGAIELVADLRIELDAQEQLGNTVKSILGNPWVLRVAALLAAVAVLYVLSAIVHNARRKRAKRTNYRGKRRR